MFGLFNEPRLDWNKEHSHQVRAQDMQLLIDAVRCKLFLIAQQFSLWVPDLHAVPVDYAMIWTQGFGGYPALLIARVAEPKSVGRSNLQWDDILDWGWPASSPRTGGWVQGQAQPRFSDSRSG